VKKKLISVLVPAYNEQDCISELHRRLNIVTQIENKYKFEFIIVENGSIDSTWDILRDLSKKDRRLKVIRLSRNFRMDGGITAGLEYVKGEACVIMCADLQDPPEFISKFLREWEQGWENIYGLVIKRNGTNWLRSINSRLFYLLAGKLSNGMIPRNASDFRLVDKKVYLTVKSMQEKNRFVRGLFAWSGFKTKGLAFERPPRFAGSSNANSLGVLDLALKGIFAHSYIPIKLITLIGISSSIISILSLITFSTIWLFRGVPFAGFGSIMSAFFVLTSILFFLIGIIGEYIALIYEEVKNRPNYIVSDTLGL
jgi:dolichol-phosphate mannosyltransferase